MITEKDLLEAIAECQGDRHPNANTCIKLAAYYTILNEIRPKEMAYSFDSGSEVIGYESETEFADLIRGRPTDEVMPVMDELMTALSVVNPRMYAGVLRKLKGR